MTTIYYDNRDATLEPKNCLLKKTTKDFQVWSKRAQVKGQTFVSVLCRNMVKNDISTTCNYFYDNQATV